MMTEGLSQLFIYINFVVSIAIVAVSYRGFLLFVTTRVLFRYHNVFAFPEYVFNRFILLL